MTVYCKCCGLPIKFLSHHREIVAGCQHFGRPWNIIRALLTSCRRNSYCRSHHFIPNGACPLTSVESQDTRAWMLDVLAECIQSTITQYGTCTLIVVGRFITTDEARQIADRLQLPFNTPSGIMYTTKKPQWYIRGERLAIWSSSLFINSIIWIFFSLLL